MKEKQNRAQIPPCELCSADGRTPVGSQLRYKEFSEKVYACKEEGKSERQ